MDVLLLDVAQTLEAAEVRLPGGEPVVTLGDPSQHQGPEESQGVEDDDLVGGEQEEEEEDETVPDLTPGPSIGRQGSAESSPTSSSNQGSSSPLRLETSSEIRGLASQLEDLQIRRTQGIGVGG
jgi:hypothetical protein